MFMVLSLVARHTLHPLLHDLMQLSILNHPTRIIFKKRRIHCHIHYTNPREHENNPLSSPTINHFIFTGYSFQRTGSTPPFTYSHFHNEVILHIIPSIANSIPMVRTSILT